MLSIVAGFYLLTHHQSAKCQTQLNHLVSWIPAKLQTQQRLQLPPMRGAETASFPYLSLNYHPSGSRPPPPTLPIKMAVAYANIFMGSLETKLLSKSSLKICFYKRYIDDILIITDDTEDHLTNFIRELNEFHPTIKFTAEYHQERITFLDVDIYKGPNFNQTQCLDFETHIKATNPRLHVHALSHHPDSVKKGIIIGEVKRLLRTNSNRETFNKSVIKYETQMQTRGYSLNFIKSLTNKRGNKKGC